MIASALGASLLNRWHKRAQTLLHRRGRLDGNVTKRECGRPGGNIYSTVTTVDLNIHVVNRLVSRT